jgi:hypothetical protein
MHILGLTAEGRKKLEAPFAEVPPEIRQRLEADKATQGSRPRRPGVL